MSLATAAPWFSVLVWGCWAAMSVAAVAAIMRWGRNVPLAEDWLMVGPLTGNEPDLSSWLWAQNNEHRVPLPRLFYLLVLKAGGGDFRTGMFFNAFALSTLSAGMILTARRIRGGRIRLTDAFFPVAFLHLGQWENLVWGWQIQFVISVVLSCLLLLVAVRTPNPAGRDPWIAGTCVLLLPLSGANGLILAVTMAPWLLVSALRARDASEVSGFAGAGSGGRTRVASSAYVLAMAVGAFVLTGAYLVGYERATWNPPSPGPGASLRTAARFLAVGFGPATETAWRGFAVGLIGVGLITAILLVYGWGRAEETDRTRRLGMVSFGVGMVTLALAVGWGRAALVPSTGIPDRYALLSLPALCLAYFAADLYAPTTLRRVLQGGLLVTTLLLLPANSAQGFGWRNWYTIGMDRVMADLDAGATAEELARENGDFLMHWDSAGLAQRIEMLRMDGRGPFAAVRTDNR